MESAPEQAPEPGFHTCLVVRVACVNLVFGVARIAQQLDLVVRRYCHTYRIRYR
jgi:hypothetical protein